MNIFNTENLEQDININEDLLIDQDFDALHPAELIAITVNAHRAAE